MPAKILLHKGYVLDFVSKECGMESRPPHALETVIRVICLMSPVPAHGVFAVTDVRSKQTQVMDLKQQVRL